MNIEKLAVTLEHLGNYRIDTLLRPASRDIIVDVENAFKTYFENVPDFGIFSSENMGEIIEEGRNNSYAMTRGAAGALTILSKRFNYRSDNVSFSIIEHKAERAEIERAARENGTWLKAPNGEDSKLTPEQWTAVRTHAFKQWFGDWESVSLFRNAYRRMMVMAPVAALTGNEFSKAWTPDIMAKYWDSVCSGKVLHPELGYILLTRRSAKDCLAHGAMRKKIAVFYKVHEVIKNGVIFDEKKNWKGRGYDTCSLAASVTIAGKEYICQVIVKRLKDRNQFYLHEVELKEKLPTEERTGFYTGLTSGGAKGLIAQKADEVNTIWEKCSKVVDENGEPLVMYHGSPTSGIREFDAAATDSGLMYEVFLNIRDKERFYERNGGALHARAVAANEIKSATDNRGTVDGSNADITLSMTRGAEDALTILRKREGEREGERLIPEWQFQLTRPRGARR